MGKDDFSVRKTPPSEEEWQKIWPILDIIHRSLWFLKPLVAFKENWQAWLVAAGVIIFINSPRIVAALEILLTGWKG